MVAADSDPRLARFYKDTTPRKKLRTAVDWVRTCGDEETEAEWLTGNAWRIIETCFETVEQYERMQSGEWVGEDAAAASSKNPLKLARRMLRGEKVIEEGDWLDVFFLVRRVIDASAAAAADDATAAARAGGGETEEAPPQPAAKTAPVTPTRRPSAVAATLWRVSGIFGVPSSGRKKRAPAVLSPSARILLLCRKLAHPRAATAARLEGVRLLLQLSEGLLTKNLGGGAPEADRCADLLVASIGGDAAATAEWGDDEADAAAAFHAGPLWKGQLDPGATRVRLRRRRRENP